MSKFTCEKVENCYATSQTYSYSLDFRIGEEFLDALSPLGTIEIKRSFRRPFFFLNLPDGSEIRGALGDDRIKASFPNDSAANCKSAFEIAFSLLLDKNRL